MYYAVYLPLLLPLAAVPALRALAPRLAPRLAAWLLTAAAVQLAAFSTLALVVLVGMGASTVPALAALGHFSPTVLPGVPSTARLTGYLAAAALVPLAVRAARACLRHIRALGEAHAAGRGFGHDNELVVVPDTVPMAYALPAFPGRIVVSSGMLHALAPDERQALLAHERAHLTGRHHLLLVAADLSAAANPLLRRLVPALEYAVERSADEAAAGNVGDRRTAARAVAHAAMATRRAAGGAAGPGRKVPHPAALHASFGPVPQRVAALLSPEPPAARATLATRVAAVAVACLFVAGACSAAEAAGDLHAAVEAAQAAGG
jgi:Zn-dependent protease with chaperone function